MVILKARNDADTRLCRLNICLRLLNTRGHRSFARAGADRFVILILRLFIQLFRTGERGNGFALGPG